MKIGLNNNTSGIGQHLSMDGTNVEMQNRGSCWGACVLAWMQLLEMHASLNYCNHLLMCYSSPGCSGAATLSASFKISFSFNKPEIMADWLTSK